MAWRYHGHARTRVNNPEAYAICDRCGQLYNLNDIQFQYDWRGLKLQNLYIRVCRRCYDRPFEHYKPIITPPDPIPVRQPRIDQYRAQMPYILTDTNGREIQDTTGTFMTATSQVLPPPLSNANSTVVGTLVDTLSNPLLDDSGNPITADGLGPAPEILTTPQAMDRYTLRAPFGGPVILIPD